MPKLAKRIAIALAVVAVLFSVASMAADHMISESTFQRQEIPERSLVAHYADVQEDYDRVPVTFMSADTQLQGYIYGPENNDQGLVVFAHGIWSWHQDYMTMICWLVDHGWKVFAYDATGCGESEGDSTKSFAQSAYDLDAALTYVESDPDLAAMPKVLLGHSWGGFAVAAELGFDHDVQAVVTMSGFQSPLVIMYDSADSLMGPLGFTQRPFLWIENKMRLGKDSNINAVDAINGCDVPVLVVHGTADEVVSYDSAGIIAARDRITNPHVEYLVFDQENRNGHNTYFYETEAKECFDQLGERAAEIDETYQGDRRELELDRLLEESDIVYSNTMNPELMEPIDAFYREALGL